MNSKIRIASLALGLGLAGTVAVAWGAESVINLVSQGEVAIRNVKDSRAAYEDGLKRNKDLAAQSQQITADNQQLQAGIDAYNKQSSAVKQEIADYTAKCSGKKLKQKEYDECTATQSKVSKDVDAANAVPATLNKQQANLAVRVNKYNSDMKDMQVSAPKLQSDFTDKLSKDEDWLNKVRDFIASPAVQPYAQKANCPDTKNIAKNVDQVIDQSEKYLACLKKIAGTG
ncbi:MAG: hypothetical protein ACRESC_00830 [Gammaproteobacteria bacterium]